jgi:hypothetical protein
MRTTCAGIALALSLLLVGGCDSTTCTYQGQTHKSGETYPAGDGCNTCSCGPDGLTRCSTAKCVTDGPPRTDSRVPDGPALSCPAVNPPSGAGTALQGQACSGTLHCTYLIEKCVGYTDVEWSCDCQSGKWQCNRGYDCPRDGGRDTSALCVNWQDMGLDCCDVCTAIYETCKSSVADKQKKTLTGQECLTTCGSAGAAQKFYQCMGLQVSCDQAKLQSCFDQTQP